ncbi:hypothetical protein LBMAG56_32450 [Verrucomicrobiota bacterium]|nr:hypothetical protein LBMAG56_32450 [Verrucomicrobiota bacterium]
MNALIFLFATLCLCPLATPTAPARAATSAGVFATTIKPEDVEAAAFAQWVEGRETPVVTKDGVTQFLWTTRTAPSHAGLLFGESKSPGVRHLRIGFKQPVAVGTVLVRAGGTLSVLKPGAAAPGALDDEGAWVSAERHVIRGAAVATGVGEVGADGFALWVLPPGTMTRALRFTHTAQPTDKLYAGALGGVLVLAERVANLAPQAVAAASDNPQKAALVNNERLEKWSRDLWDTESETPRATIKDQPAWLVLSWAQPVRLRGLAALWAGFGAAEVQALAAATQAPALEATDADWQAVSSWTGVDTQYPRQLAVNWLDFGRDVTTRAVRLRITEVAKVNHPHLNTATKNGQRVWLGELMALHSLGGEPLASAVLPVEQTELPHPPIPIRFSLPRAGLVTLVIEDATGLRIRNLVSETPFPAGENTAWWDGLDDLGRDPEAAKHGIYSVPGKPVKPGRYRVRGLAHDELALRYEFPIYTAGNPAWNTADNTGAWLANHTPPSAAVFLPADRSPDGQPRVYLGSFVSEGTHGLAWVDLDGKKLGGEKWVGGVWTGAPFLARDDGRERAAEHLAYVASVWTSGKGTTDAELRLTALTAKDDLAVYRETWPLPAKNPKDNQLAAEISGLAVQDGVIVVALKRLQKLVFVNARTKQRLGEHELRDSRGLAFDPQGRLLALSGNRLLRFAFNQTGKLGAPAVFIADQLEDPQHLTTDAAGRVYVSDWGRAHQVKVFSADGKFLHAIGKPGVPRGGIYDAQHLNHPAGLTLDSRQQLWVTENDEQPKRVSVWTPEGKFLRAFYGPAEYGGGGFLDSGDPGLFHYSGMTFRLDWQTGRSELIAVPYRVDAARLELGFRNKPPEFALYRQGRRYFSNCYNNNPTGGSSTAFLFVERDHEAVPVAGMGRAKDWNVLQRPEFKPRWPQGIDPLGDPNKNPALFAWSDLNGDGLAQPDEVQILPGQCGGVTVMPDLAFVLSRWEGKAGRFAAQRFTDAGVPVYDLEKRDTIADGVLGPKSSGGDQVLVHSNGWSVVTLGVAPFAPQSLCGVFKGAARWSYPSVWPGLHASHEAAVPDRPGMVIGSTRLLGGFVESKAGPLWCVNGNMGPMYLFTADGLFVQSLFQDVRLGQPWSMPAAQRGMLLNGVSPHDENFFPSIGQTPDGRVFIQDGARSSLVRVDGLDTLQRLPEQEITVTEADLRSAQQWTVQSEAARQKSAGRETLVVAWRDRVPVVDGKLDDWSAAQWAVVDKRGTRAWFNSDAKPYDVSAAASVAGDRLFVAFRTGDANLLKNSGDTPNALFKTGGALDVMLGTDAQAAPNRAEAVAGDLRLLVSIVNKKAVATLYRAVVPGTAAGARVPFSSPWRTIHFDRVEDVSAQLQFAADAGNYEFSIPLSTLGWKPAVGAVLQADLGVLRGNGFETVQRAYWSNKATAITADVPSEALLTPQLWGRWRIEKRP